MTPREMLLVLVCLSGGLGCSAPAPEPAELEATRQGLVVEVPVDSPVVGSVSSNDEFGAAWDGQRYVVMLSDRRQMSCVTYLPDGTLERRVVLPFVASSIHSFSIDGAGEAWALLTEVTAGISVLRLGRACAGPFLLRSTAVRGFITTGARLAGGVSVVTDEVDGGERQLALWWLDDDGGTSGPFPGRPAAWFAAAGEGDQVVVASHRRANDASPLWVDFIEARTGLLRSSTALAKNPLVDALPWIQLSSGVALVGTANGVSGPMARRFFLDGGLQDTVDLDFRNLWLRAPAPGGFLLHSTGTVPLRFSIFGNDGGSSTPVDPVPDFDGGAPQAGHPTVLFGGSAPLLLTPLPAGSLLARPLDRTLAPAGPLAVVLPRVNEQSMAAWAPAANGAGGYATWLDGREAATRLFVRRFDAQFTPLTAAVPVSVHDRDFGSPAAAVGEGVLLFSRSGSSGQFIHIAPDGDGGLAASVKWVVSGGGGFTQSAVVATREVVYLLNRTYNSAAAQYVVQGRRFRADGGALDAVAWQLPPIGNFSTILAATDDELAYFTVQQSGGANLYRMGPTGAPESFARFNTTVVQLVRSSEGLCGLGTTGFECRDRDGGATHSGTWVAAGTPSAAFDGERVYSCVLENFLTGASRWYVLEADGGFFEFSLPGERCASFSAAGPARFGGRGPRHYEVGCGCGATADVWGWAALALLVAAHGRRQAGLRSSDRSLTPVSAPDTEATH